MSPAKLFLPLLFAATAAYSAAWPLQPNQRGLVERNGHGGFDVWLPQADMVAVIAEGAMELRGPMVAPEWSSRFTFTGVGRKGRSGLPWEPCEVSCTEAGLRWAGNGVDIEYLLEADGLRQNFHIAERPPGAGPLELALALNSPFCPKIDANGDLDLVRSNGQVAHTYHGLTVWDACGSPLHAWMKTSPDGGQVACLQFRVRAQFRHGGKIEHL